MPKYDKVVDDDFTMKETRLKGQWSMSHFVPKYFAVFDIVVIVVMIRS